MCQNYGWSLRDAMGLTLPQVFMMNHAAWCNSAKMDERIKRDEGRQQQIVRPTGVTKLDDMDPVVVGVGKRLSQCSSEEIAGQFTKW